MDFVDGDYYIKTKLAQLTAAGAVDANGEPFNQFTLRQAFANAGLTPEEHYKAYGRYEGINPNAYFNEKEYLHAKLTALQTDPDTAAFWADRSVNDLQAVIQSAGMTPAEHYEQYGSKETTKDGHLLNPSNAFDANAYVAAKLAQLQSADNPSAEERALWADKTVADLVKALQDADISPVTHYQNYGASEASTAKVPLVQTVPVAQRMPNDPARETITGEIVPGNYNPATPAPGAATPAPVTKPADMGGLADAAVSPPVHVPAKPLPVPGDANYTPPPAGLVDSNNKPVLPPASSGGSWVIVNPDGGGTIIKPDGSTGGTYPPGSINPDNPVIPDSKPDTGGGSGGSGSGGSGSGDPVTPPQEAGKHVDLTDVPGKQNLALGTGDDTVVGVKPGHLPQDSVPGKFDRGHIDGKAGNDSITFTPDTYDLQLGQLRSFEHVTVKNTTQDFTWHIGDTDFPTGTYQSKAETAITAADLTTGKIRVDKPTGAALDLSITTSSGSNVDNVLVRLGQSGKTNITTDDGNDRVVLVGKMDSGMSGATLTDAVFTSINADLNTTANGTTVTGTLDLGAGANELKLYGNVDLTGAMLKTDTGSIAVELMGYKSIARMTKAQYEALTTGGNIKVATPNSADNDQNTSWLQVSGASTDTIDLSKVTIANDAYVNFVLSNGIGISNTPVVTSDGTKGGWGYRILDAGTYAGTVGNEDLFEVDQAALTNGSYTGNSGDNDRFRVQLAGEPTVTINAGNGSTVTGFKMLEIQAAFLDDTGTTYKPTNIVFGAGTSFESVRYVYDSNDALDITNLTGTPTVEMGIGSDDLTGVKATHFGVGKYLDGGIGGDSVTLAEADADFTISAGQLQNFEIVTFNAGKNVSWTLGDGDCIAPETGTTTVTVNASAITGALTFNASAETETTVSFVVTGGSGADTITGGAGNDTYVYTTLAHSLASAFDTVTFEDGDKIGVTSAQYTAITGNNGLVATSSVAGTGVLATDIATAITATPMAANGAALVTFTGANTDTYLVLDDGDGTFDANTDAVIKIVGTITGAGDFVAIPA